MVAVARKNVGCTPKMQNHDAIRRRSFLTFAAAR
jgi:hypothetical protein